MLANYIPFLKKAYIDPIRTVTVIDDEYPTLDDLINKGKDSFDKDDLDRLSDIIKISRHESFNWLLDVYNGKEEEVDTSYVSSRLHHSDLLILDYHLDGENDGFCQKSIDIIKNLSSNRHFNIVAVHTKGYEGQKGTVNDVFIDIVISLLSKPKFLTIPPKVLEDIESEIDDWNIEEDGISQKIIDSISILDLLSLLRDFSNSILNSDFEHTLWWPFSNYYNEKPENIKIEKANLVKWLCYKKFEKYVDFFRNDAYEFLEWGVNGELNWIKTEDLFLTVIGKKQTPVSDIPDKILEALSQSRPHPHELILSKLRSEVESNGISASSSILQRKYLQAAWLKELLKENSQDAIKSVSWSVVSKLWEELAQEIKPQIGQFTFDLVMGLKQLKDPLAEFIDKSILENKNEIIKHANCFSCSRKISYHHLITGHVVKFKGNYWLCLTPMCDLVPGQKSDNSLMSVTLVQMYDSKEALKVTRGNMCHSLGGKLEDFPELSDSDIVSQIIDYSTENNLLFIEPEEKNSEIIILSFTYGLDGKSNPKAKDFYVEEFGVFDSETRKIKLRYVEPSLTQDKKSILSQIEAEAVVVAELRYEYALNLLRRLGVARSRVGLDFIR